MDRLIIGVIVFSIVVSLLFITVLFSRITGLIMPVISLLLLLFLWGCPTRPPDPLKNAAPEAIGSISAPSDQPA